MFFLKPGPNGSAALLSLAAILAALVGCNSSSEPITSETTKYEVGEESPTAETADPAAGSDPVATGQPGGGQDEPGIDLAGGRLRPGDTPRQPPSTPSTELDAPPGDSPDELMAYISRLANRRPVGNTGEEQLADFRRNQQMLMDAAEKLMASDADTRQLQAAAQAKIMALSQLSQLGDDDAVTRLKDFVKSLQESPKKDLAQFGAQISFAMKMDELSRGEEVDADSVIQDLQGFIGSEEKDANLLNLGNQVAGVLERTDNPAQAIQAYQLVAAAFENTEDPQLKAGAARLQEQAQLLEAGIAQLANKALQGEEGAADAFVAELNAFAAEQTPGVATFTIIQEVAPSLEVTDPAAAEQLYSLMVELFQNHPREDLAKVATDMAQKFEKRAALLGSPFEVKGVTIDGSEFDWSKYKGKVVLVDFWATWCGPCLQEMPNIKANYEKYRDQGFEVVGVNLDENVNQLQEFVSLQDIPWPSVLPDDPEKRGWEHPMVEQCGVVAIPFMVLVGRDGNVIALNVRGDALGEKLAELFPAESAAPASGG